jgi:hypothetical protein
VEEVDPEEQERRRKRAERFGIPVMVRFRVDLPGDSQVLTQTLHRVRRLDVLRLRFVTIIIHVFLHLRILCAVMMGGHERCASTIPITHTSAAALN